METKLLPCPFCGGEAELTRDYDNECSDFKLHIVLCRSCWAQTVACRAEAEAIEAWNSRAWTVADNDAEVLGDVAAGLFRDLMQADPDTARTWALGWPELFGKEDTDAD